MIAELKDTERYLKEKGIGSSYAEAEQILCHLLRCEKIDLYTSDTPLDRTRRRGICELAERRANGEPLQYILGRACFYGFEFKIKRGVFIPRLETEILVDTVIKKLTAYSLQLTANILDLCTGSGCIAISLTKMLPYYRMFASDILMDAVRSAGGNARLNGVSSKIELRCGNLFDPWREKEEFFDAIVCNPPYIKSGQLKDLPCDVKSEPIEALDGGTDGLRFYRKIIKEAPFYLKEKGCIFFELDPETADDVRDILSEDFMNIEIVKDYNFKERVIFAQRKQ